MGSLDIAAITIVTVNYIVICPLIGYFLYEFGKYAKESLLIHRSDVIVYIMNILVMFALIFERGYALYVGAIEKNHVIPTWTVRLFFNVTWSGILILFSCKAYNLYFQQQLNLAISDISWRQNINPNDQNWYIKHKQTFGNPLYIMKFSLIPYILFIIIQSLCIPLIGEGLILDLLHWLFASISISVAMYISCKVRFIEDIYYIKNEIIYQSISVLIPIVAFMIIIIISHILCYTNMNNHVLYSTVHQIEWILHNVLLQWMSLSLTLFNTAYPLHLLHRERERRLSDAIDAQIAKQQPTGIEGICYIISQYTSFKAFMQYLVSEFSTENLLFLTELIQIKHSFQLQNHNILRIPKKAIIEPGVNPWDTYHNLDKDDQDNQDDHDVTDGSIVNLPKLCRDEVSNMNDDDKYMVIDFNVEICSKLGLKNMNSCSNSPPFKLENEKSLKDIVFNNISNHSNDARKQSLSLSDEGIIFQQRESAYDIKLGYYFTYLFDEIGNIRCKLKLPLELPQSIILLQNKTNLHDQMKQLYNKYIRSGSLNQINISYEIRNCLKTFFESEEIHKLPKYKNYKLFNIMDECGFQILLLMQDSMNRFLSSKLYKKLLIQKQSKLLSKSKSSTMTSKSSQIPTNNDNNNNNNDDIIIVHNASQYDTLRAQYGYNM